MAPKVKRVASKKRKEPSSSGAAEASAAEDRGEVPTAEEPAAEPILISDDDSEDDPVSSIKYFSLFFCSGCQSNCLLSHTVVIVLLLTEITDDESDYEIEYEVLSGGLDEPWEYVGVSHDDIPSTSKEVGFSEGQITLRDTQDLKHEIVGDDKAKVDILDSKANVGASDSHPNGKDHEKHESDMSTSEVEVQENSGVDAAVSVEPDEDSCYGHEDLERLMCEIGGMRANLRLMPDFQRREMAAKLAMKMAAMFVECSDEDESLE
ncbi:uncharacterized protein LOC109846033 [Asparagus officinalis]|uniref:uncharacterized protein LOC109846033 n=1 Tax=Asparagus officinalis TaxID=4686 RepID=UPI00098E7DF6|nr:uncharacterized protein LOC109846033 [Asparagus officinalis]